MVDFHNKLSQLWQVSRSTKTIWRLVEANTKEGQKQTSYLQLLTTHLFNSIAKAALTIEKTSTKVLIEPKKHGLQVIQDRKLWNSDRKMVTRCRRSHIPESLTRDCIALRNQLSAKYKTDKNNMHRNSNVMRNCSHKIIITDINKEVIIKEGIDSNPAITSLFPKLDNLPWCIKLRKDLRTSQKIWIRNQ